MTEQEKLAIIEECMDLDEGTISPSDELANFEEWDSLAALSFIAAMAEKFDKKLETADIKALVTVADALKLMD